MSLLNQLEDGQYHTEELWSPDDEDVDKKFSGHFIERTRVGSGCGAAASRS